MCFIKNNYQKFFKYLLINSGQAYEWMETAFEAENTSCDRK